MRLSIELLPASPIEEGNYPADWDNSEIALKICQTIDQHRLARFYMELDTPEPRLLELNFSQDFHSLHLDDLEWWLMVGEEPSFELSFQRLGYALRLDAVAEEQIRVLVFQSRILQAQYLCERDEVLSHLFNAIEELNDLLRILFPKAWHRLQASGYWT